MRIYTELVCGCLISCDGGGGLIPCENNSDVCQSYKYLDEHLFCSFCGECTVCYEHLNCTLYQGGVE